jgi:hypothetical protein
MDSETILKALMIYIQTQKEKLFLLEKSDFNCGVEKAYNEIIGLVQPYIDEVIKDRHENETASDPVDHPSHYTDGNIEVIDFIADKGLVEGFCKGNVIKYVSRAGKKASAKLSELDKEIQDLQKARWYLDYLIQYYKNSQGKEEQE